MEAEALALSQKVLEIEKRPQFEVWSNQYQYLLKRAKETKVKDDVTDGVAESILSENKKIFDDEIEPTRKAIVTPYNNFVSAINKTFKALASTRDEINRILKPQRLTYITKKEGARREAEAKLRKQAVKLQKKLGDDIIVPMPIIPEEKTKGQRKDWDVEVTDLKALIQAIVDGKIQAEAVMPNLRFLKSLVTAGIRDLPGCIIKERVVLPIYKT